MGNGVYLAGQISGPGESSHILNVDLQLVHQPISCPLTHSTQQKVDTQRNVLRLAVSAEARFLTTAAHQTVRLVPHIKPEIWIYPVFLVNPYQLLDGQSGSICGRISGQNTALFLISGCEERV